MTRFSISLFLFLIGLLWAGVVSWFFVMAGGVGQLSFIYISKMFLLFSWLFIGPLMLILGAILQLGTHQRTGSILSLIACVILTLMVGCQTIASVVDLGNPLVAKFFSYYALTVISVALTILADVGAIRFYRLIQR